MTVEPVQVCRPADDTWELAASLQCYWSMIGQEMSKPWELQGLGGLTKQVNQH
jgi:hypothetical protein